jgi:hypothetical protein
MKFNDRSMALLGIPDLPPRAFIRKAGGGIIPQGGGGSAPTTTAEKTTGLPAWALPYAQDTLAKQQALSNRPYQAYEAPRIAGFTPLQQQAQQQAAGMQTNGATGAGIGLAGAAGMGGLNTQTFGSAQADQYMSPYIQNVVDIGKREAQRQSGIQGTQQQAQAAQAGAFGGSRDAIMRAERERNLATQMGDIQQQGNQMAYTNAQNQFNADQNRSLQGLGLAANAAGQLGQLGGQQFQQGVDINKLQSAYGAQQQSMNQQGLTQAYQDFMNQQNYPQQQLGYMANMINGLPLGSTSTGTTTYNEGSPSGLQSLGSLASTAYGLSKFFAKGGYIDKEKSVTDEDNIAEFVRGLDDQELAQAKQAAEASGDKVKLEVIVKEEGLRASIQRGGLASLPVNMNKMMPTTLSAARGGIVAFADEGLVEDEDGGGGDDGPVKLSQLGGAGNRAIYDKSLERMMAIAEGNAGRQFKEFTPEDRAAARANSLKEQMLGVTADPYKAYGKSIDEMDAGRDKRLEQAKGLAAIKFGAGLVKGNNLSRAIAGAGADAGESYAAALQAEERQKQSLATMRFHMGEAQRKEQMGMSGEARKDAALAQKARLDASNAENRKNAATGAIYRGIAMASRPQAVRGGGAGSNNADKNYFSALKAVDNVSRIISNEKKDQTYVQMQQDASLTPDTPAKKNRVEKAQKYITETDARHKAMQDRAEGVLNRYTPGGNAPAAPAVATKTPDIASVAGAPKGSKIGKMVTGKGHEVIDASGKLIGYAQ